jgi:hypothetical protein
MPKLCVSDQADGLAAKPRETALNRGIVGEFAVAREGREFGEQAIGVIGKMRPLGMTRDLRLLPRRQIGIEIFKRLQRFGFKARNIVADRGAFTGRRKRAQFLELFLKLANRPFEIENGTHHEIKAAQAPQRAETGRCGGLKSSFPRTKRDVVEQRSHPASAFGQGVQIPHHVLQPVIQHMGINLGRRDIGMAQ